MCWTTAPPSVYDLRLDPRPKNLIFPPDLHSPLPSFAQISNVSQVPATRFSPTRLLFGEIREAHVLLDAVDPAADDTGRTGYTPPRSHFVVKGSFDLRRVTLAADDSCSYWTLTFQRLSNPGWHPEYGFTLTFVAIALDTDGVAEQDKCRL